MFHVIDYVEENSVAVVNDLEIKGTKYVLRPHATVTLVEKLVKEGLRSPVAGKAGKSTSCSG